MDAPLQAILLAVDGAAISEIRTHIARLQGVSMTCSEANFETGLASVRDANPDIVMVILDGNTHAALSIVEEANQFLPGRQIFALSRVDTTENILQAMRAGATEFLALPLDPGQLMKAIIKATALQRLTQPASTGGHLWTLYSPKGGTGTTITTANLALELHAATRKSVCVVDLDFQSGDLALALNLNPVYTIVDIALNFRRLDSVFLQGTLTRHPSGIYLLAAPQQGSIDGTAIPGDQIRSVLDLLKSMYDVVIVDTPSVLSEPTVAGLWSATRLLVLIELSLPSLRGYRRTLEALDALGISRDHVVVIISKHGNCKSAVPLEEAKKSLELSVAHLLPQDPETALEAVNKGLALAEVKRSSPLRRSIANLAQDLVGNHPRKEEPRKRHGIFGGIFSS